MFAICLALILAAAVTSLATTALARSVGRKLNALDAPGVAGQIKAAARRVPNTGGIGIFIAIALPMLSGLLFVRGIDPSATAEWRTDFSLIPAAIEDHIAGIQQQTPAALYLLAGLLAMHILGLIDDRKPLGPRFKLAFMLAVGAAVVVATDTRLLTLLDSHVGGRWASVIVTVLWIAAVTNAFNFLDNMDGLSAGVAAICASCFLVIALVGGQWFVAATLALLVGALLGFLRFNFPWTRSGASIFMGDGGSLVVGFLLAFLSVRITYLAAARDWHVWALVGNTPTHGPTVHDSGAPWYAVAIPLIILAIPLYDFCSVCAIRISQGRSPFVGDLQHFSHRLVGHGLSRRAAVLTIYGCTAVTGIGAIALPSLQPWQAALVGVQTLLVLVVIALYEWSRGGGTP